MQINTAYILAKTRPFGLSTKSWLRGRESLLVILLAAVVLFGWLGSRGLGEPDEGRFAEISREMALQTNWLIPHLNGVPHFQKPPLTYWISAVWIRLFGANEWAVRLTPALAAFGTFLCTMFIAGVLYGRSCRWRAGLVLLASMGFFVIARLITTDMLLTFCITAAIAGLIGRTYRKHWLWLLAFYGGMGLGFLAKGPLGFVIPAATALALQMEQRRHGEPVVRLYWVMGLPVALLIGFSWYLALVYYDRSLFEYFFRYEFIDRIASNTHNRAKPFWFYPAVLALFMLPWSGFVVIMIRDLWQRRRVLDASRLWLFGGWLLFPFILLSLIVSKLSTYMLPLMPPLAIVVARWFEHPFTGKRWRKPAQISTLAVVLLLLLIPAIGLSPRIHLPIREDIPLFFGASMILAMTALLLTVRAISRGVTSERFMFLMAAIWACILLMFASQAEKLMTGGNRPVRELTEQLLKLDPDGQRPVLIYEARAQGVEFYLRRPVYRAYSKSDVVLPLKGDLQERIYRDAEETLNVFSNIQSYIIAKSKRFQTAPELSDWHVLASNGPWILLASPALELPPPIISNEL